MAQVVRTDFSDDATWRRICAAIAAPSNEDFLANVSFVDDPVLVVKRSAQPPEPFRSALAGIQSIENNLSIANMNWEDLPARRSPPAACSAGSDGS